MLLRPDASVGVLVLAKRPGLWRLRFRRALEQEAGVRRDERIGSRDGVRVVHGAVLAREGDPARVLAQPVLEPRADLARPLLEPSRRVVDQALELGDLLRLP